MNTQLLNALEAVVATNAALGVIAPKALNLVTERIQDPEEKENTVWAVCFALSLVLAAWQGAFNPIIPLWQGAIHAGPMALLNAAWGSFLIVGASFGTLLTVATQAHDKFWNPRAKAKAAKLDERLAARVAINTTGSITAPIAGQVVNSLQRIISNPAPDAPADQTPDVDTSTQNQNE